MINPMNCFFFIQKSLLFHQPGHRCGLPRFETEQIYSCGSFEVDIDQFAFRTVHGVDGFAMYVRDVKFSRMEALCQVDGYLPECGVGEDLDVGE